MMDDLFAKMAVLNLLVPLLAVCACMNGAAGAADGGWASSSRQAVVVISSAWDSPSAVLVRYERENPGLPWRAVGEKAPVVLGRGGLGWGIGVHPQAAPGEPVKREGDGRSPAGIFRLSAVFGYAAPEAMSWVRLPYVHATPSLLCIDDPASKRYNRIVDGAKTESDWTSCEKMLRGDGQYRMGIVVDHNAGPVLPGGGSCIFMHVWAGPGRATSGCTAMAAAALEEIIRWLDPEARPFLIQLPEAVYGRERREWNLP